MIKTIVTGVAACLLAAQSFAAEMTSEQVELQLLVDAAEAAVTKGQWSQAREKWNLALEKVSAVAGDDEYQAVLYYEHGRSSGVACDWSAAEKSLNKALELDRKSQGPFFMSLLELARLHLAQQNYEQSKVFFDQLLPELKARNAAVIDPKTVATMISDYATVLEQLGAVAQAKPFREQAASLRAEHAVAPESPATPYGSQCQ